MNLIYQIEISAICNLKCSYCPHPNSTREKGLMSKETFLKSMELVGQLGQDWICLQNFGEPLMHPDIVEYVSIASQTVNNVVFSSNGTLLTRELAIQLKDAGLTEIYISNHCKKSLEGIKNCEGLGILTDIRKDFHHDWAGTSNKHEKYDIRQSFYSQNGCEYFIGDQVVVVLWDGRINSCCIDMDGTGIIGTVWDTNSLYLAPKPFQLCQTCNVPWVNYSLYQSKKSLEI